MQAQNGFEFLALSLDLKLETFIKARTPEGENMCVEFKIEMSANANLNFVIF